ncbi:hypothetical protein B0I73DRAFT_162946 [Yarrowia lipolytica]|uniref:Uncharacterized protein n=1 Tax=Yarrowia lipolytica TaxID=4952 RepID=A0A371C074_YARLL|nr:hypothetical protein B0I71DRAFT_168555 [Yarrowia lipolytica]RDW37469.1 hypothetical protein B0I73DRAFT_162946 [Yarrowia lipolytica]RDW51928.1 hypothetical protein B0I75DRAFT_169709 [Yarrowia lipolytica]
MSCHQFSCNHGGEICSFLSGLTVTTNDEAVGWVAEVRLDFDSFILSTVYERDKKTLACEEFASELKLEAHGMYCTPHSMVTMALKEPFDEESFEALDDFDHIDDLPDADNRKVIRMLEPGDAIVAHARSANSVSAFVLIRTLTLISIVT